MNAAEDHARKAAVCVSNDALEETRLKRQLSDTWERIQKTANRESLRIYYDDLDASQSQTANGTGVPPSRDTDATEQEQQLDNLQSAERGSDALDVNSRSEHFGQDELKRPRTMLQVGWKVFSYQL